MPERPLQEEEFARRVGENVRRLRVAADLSQATLAAMAELRRTQLGLIESGLRVAPADALWKLALCLGTDFGELLAGLTWAPSASGVASLEAAPA